MFSCLQFWRRHSYKLVKKSDYSAMRSDAISLFYNAKHFWWLQIWQLCLGCTLTVPESIESIMTSHLATRSRNSIASAAGSLALRTRRVVTELATSTDCCCCLGWDSNSIGLYSRLVGWLHHCLHWFNAMMYRKQCVVGRCCFLALHYCALCRSIDCVQTAAIERLSIVDLISHSDYWVSCLSPSTTAISSQVTNFV